MKWPIVIDEYQILLNEINTVQFLSDDGKKDRSHFSALLKAFFNFGNRGVVIPDIFWDWDVKCMH